MPFVISIINKCVIMKLFLVNTSFGKTMIFLDRKKVFEKNNHPKSRHDLSKI